MYQLDKLKNGLTLITINLPHLNSVTSMVVVGAGSRYETKRINGLSHFLEHMFFKGSVKYPSHEQISNLIDGIGAINNAGTSKEWTNYWVKSSARHIELSTDILSSMLKEPLFQQEEIDREKGVIHEEMRMYKDMPSRYVLELFEKLLFGDQPLGWEIVGDEQTIPALKRQDFLDYVHSLYAPENMVLIFAGKLPKDTKGLAEKYFLDQPKRDTYKFEPFKASGQTKPKVDVHYKKTDQANIVLGMRGFDRKDKRRFAARLLAMILGEGSSSRLFIQVRERRGLAYSVACDHEPYIDTGVFGVYAGLKLEKVFEGLEVIKAEFMRMVSEKATPEELKKVKEMVRGKIALRSESTNFLAEYFGISYILDSKVEPFENLLKKYESVSLDEIRQVARELFKQENFTLQVIGPFKANKQFEKILQS